MTLDVMSRVLTELPAEKTAMSASSRALRAAACSEA